MLCQLGTLTQTLVDVVLARPDALVEPKLMKIVGDANRAKAVAQLFQMAVDDGYDASNLGAALRAADDMSGIEGILERAVVPDQLPMAPYPEHPAVSPVMTCL